MMGLLVFKERLRIFYAKNSQIVIPAVKFAVAFMAFYLIGKNTGFVEKLNSPLMPAVMGLVGAAAPYGVTAFLAGAFLMAQLFAVSLEVAAITLVFLMIVVLLYYGFQPGDSVLLLVTPIMFFLKIPFAVPLLVGLGGSMLSVIPVSCGAFLYYVILYVKQNAGVLSGSAQTELTQLIIQLVKSLVTNQAMLIMVAAMALCILLVHTIKNMPINYAWGIAIAAGVIVQLLVIFIGDLRFDASVSVLEVTAGMAVSAAAAAVYHFFVFAVDYTRTEYVQFEDDDYHYYVKAVPKIAVSKPDVKVQRINTRKTPRRRD